MRRAGMLRMLRQSFGLTQRQIGRILGVSGAHISLVEDGRRRLAPERARKLATYFRVSGTMRRELLSEIAREGQ